MEQTFRSRLPTGVHGRFVDVDGIRTYYLEAMPADRDAREADPVVLVHSGEFGARAELSWRWNVAELGRHFHVYAPDLVGFGWTERLYSFTDPAGLRIRHLRRFMEILAIGPAHFVGNSFGGPLTLSLAAAGRPPRPLPPTLAGSGGAPAPD